MSELRELISLVELHILSEYPHGTWVPASEKVARAFLSGQKQAIPQRLPLPPQKKEQIIKKVEQIPPPQTPKPVVIEKEPLKKEELHQPPTPTLNVPLVPYPHRDAPRKETPDLSEISNTLQKLFPKVSLTQEPLKKTDEEWKALYPKHAFISFTQSPQAALFVQQVVEAVQTKLGPSKRYVATPASLSEVITQVHIDTLHALIFCLEPSQRAQVAQWVDALEVVAETNKKEVLRKIGSIQKIAVYEVELPEEPQKASSFKAALWQELKTCLTHP